MCTVYYSDKHCTVCIWGETGNPGGDHKFHKFQVHLYCRYSCIKFQVHVHVYCRYQSDLRYSCICFGYRQLSDTVALWTQLYLKYSCVLIQKTPLDCIAMHPLTRMPYSSSSSSALLCLSQKIRVCSCSLGKCWVNKYRSSSSALSRSLPLSPALSSRPMMNMRTICRIWCVRCLRGSEGREGQSQEARRAPN